MNPEEFEAALEAVKERLLALSDAELKALSSTNFEILVADTLTQIVGLEVDYKEGSGRFPDIVFAPYGLEVKLTRSDYWTSLGNSILESTRVQEAEKIYMIFLKQGGEPDIQIRPYEQCLTEIVVTHSPRYKIDMSLEKGGTIFDRMGVVYDDYRKNDPIGTAKEYYQNIIDQVKERLWWLDEQKEEAMTPVLRQYSALSRKLKDDLRVEVMSLFPEVFGSSQDKFTRPSLYIVSQHNVHCRNFRDMLTGGGRVLINIQGQHIRIQRMIGHSIFYRDAIQTFILSVEESLLKNSWRLPQNQDIPDRIEEWKKLVGGYVGQIDGVSFSEIFDNAIFV